MTDGSTRPRVSIVILNWNGKDDTICCLQSVQRIEYQNYNVFVVDNGSSDGSVVAIRDAFPDYEVIETGANLGYSGGNNFGIVRALEAGAAYVLLLNNDTEVAPGLVSAFVEAALRHPEAGAFAARIYFHADPTRIWYAGAKWVPEDSRFTHIGWNKTDLEGDFADEKVIDYACGCAFFVAAPMLRKIGLLDDSYFLTFEETDWCYRARKQGHPSIYVPTAMLWHKVSVSFGGDQSPLASYFMTRNLLLWASRHLDKPERSKLWRRLRREILPRLYFPSNRNVPLHKRIFWGFLEFSRDCKQRYSDKVWRARVSGIRDYIFGRFGHQQATVNKILQG